MDIIATPELASYLRDDATDFAAASQIVELANGIVSEVLGDLESIPTRAKAITLEVAARAYRNPGGWVQESLDDWTGRRLDDTANAGVYLTDAERLELSGLVGGKKSVRSVALRGTFEPTETDSEELPTP